MDRGKGPYIRFVAGLLLALLVAACAPRAAPSLPTRAVLPSMTPTVLRTPIDENNAPLPLATVPAEVVVITPTEPPSKTPSPTPTPSQTPTPPTPTVTAIRSTITPLPLLPTAVMTTLTPAVVAAPVELVCESEWFFLGYDAGHCPAAEPTVSRAVFQGFEYGLMIWLAEQDAIYVLYGDMPQQPAWEVYEDTYEEGMSRPEAELPLPPYDYTFEPTRGFGRVWRANPDVRERIGWAVERWEWPFNAQVQVAEDGTIYIEGVEGGLVVLSPNRDDWRQVFPLQTFLD